MRTVVQALLLTTVTLVRALGQEILVVDPGGGGDFTEIQLAVDAARDGDTVLVKAGEHIVTKPINFNSRHELDDPASPPVKNITLRSETGPEETTIRLSNGLRHDHVVVFASRETEASLLRGFTITGRSSGGISCVRASPTVTDCIITGNSTGATFEFSSSKLTGCTISENGDGIVCTDASPTLTNCTISRNRRIGVWCSDASPTLTDSSVSQNGDAGFFCEMSSKPTITGCTISGNRSSGVLCVDSSPSLTDCTISGNAASLGGGVFCGGGSSPKLTRCTVSGNFADLDGGGIFCDVDSFLTLTSSIVWDNAGGALSLFACPDMSPDCDEPEPIVTFSSIEGPDAWRGEGNINLDPLFCGWESGEVAVSDQSGFEEALDAFRLALSAGSPCIGTGEGGADMGADAGPCDAPGERARTVRPAAGTYRLEGFSLVHRVSITGESEPATIIEGTVRGLRTGATLADLTVTKGTQGGIRLSPDESPEIRSCTIKDNSGSGVFCVGGSPTLTNCTISGNEANDGGGLHCAAGSSPTLTNCTISGNEANDGGGLHCAAGSSPTLTNCTISGNEGSVAGCTAREDLLPSSRTVRFRETRP